jgi:hypothetical protein
MRVSILSRELSSLWWNGRHGRPLTVLFKQFPYEITKIEYGFLRGARESYFVYWKTQKHFPAFFFAGIFSEATGGVTSFTSNEQKRYFTAKLPHYN